MSTDLEVMNVLFEKDEETSREMFTECLYALPPLPFEAVGRAPGYTAEAAHVFPPSSGKPPIPQDKFLPACCTSPLDLTRFEIFQDLASVVPGRFSALNVRQSEPRPFANP